jgi:hypothetical protein
VTDSLTAKRREASKNKRSRAQIAWDRAFIEHATLRGANENQVTERLNALPDRPYTLSRSSIHADLTALRKQWEKETMTEIEAFVREELRGLRLQEDELWKAWTRSQLDAETIRQKVQAHGEGALTPAEITKTKEGQCGNPAYMRLILDVRDRRAKLLGLDKPDRLDAVLHGGAEPIVFTVKLAASDLP